MLDYLTPDYHTINFMKQSSRDVTSNFHRNWVIACFGSHVNLYLFSLINEDMDCSNRAAVL